MKRLEKSLFLTILLISFIYTCASTTNYANQETDSKQEPPNLVVGREHLNRIELLGDSFHPSLLSAALILSLLLLSSPA